MRNISIALSVASILLFVGCEERESMAVTQDKRGHAYNPEGSSGSTLPNQPVAREGEIWIVTGPTDTLTSIGKKYNTTIEWLIRRNRLDKGLPPPGTNLLVPDPNITR